MANIRYLSVGAITFGAVLYMWPKASSPVAGSPPAGFKTTGVQNIEKAYSRGGATSTHTKAYGGTVQGQANDGPREGGSTGAPNGYDQEGLGDDQRADPSSKFEKAFTKTTLTGRRC